MARRFEVLFTKDGGKKRKVYNDGALVITQKNSSTTTNVLHTTTAATSRGKDEMNGTASGLGAYTVVLSDTTGKELIRKILTEEQIKEYQPSNEITLGQFSIQIEKESSAPTPASTSSHAISKDPIEEENQPVLMNTKKFLPKFQTKKLPTQNTSSQAAAPLPPASLVIDPSLLRVMREHQIEAAHFIMRCFTSNATPTPISRVVDDDDDDDNFRVPSKHQSGTELVRGAILADDMGLGKTLTAISVLWTYLKGGKCKGLIICPSSLVGNWEKEIRKWMGVRVKPLCLRSGPQAAGIVNTFRVGHPNMTPVLILSYEMFRKHGTTINATPLLDIIICDEAHRLKNVTGTKTMTALRNCKATKRLVLTGTPIQNRLSELYAILQFICPDTSQIGLDPIDRYNRAQSAGETNIHPAIIEAAERAKDTLNQMLQRVMIRRSREEILRKLLPPRREYILKCNLTEQQSAMYQQISDVMKNEWEKDVGRDTSSFLLPGLQKLRQICNFASDTAGFELKSSHAQSDPESDLDEEFNYDEDDVIKKKRSRGKQTSLPRKENRTDHHRGINLDVSAKLQLLDALIRTVHERRSLNPNGDYGKIVVVSNFTSMLDAIESLSKTRNWPSLRLDGSVLADKRVSLVDRFNRSNDPSLLFLLSSKAGGVGLNLIGANRLIMVDCDWNPAIDAQAMARIWREGQQRSVYVYRLITADRIEDAIYQRQRVKEGLHSVISLKEKSTTVADTHDDDEDEDEEEKEEDEEEEEAGEEVEVEVEVEDEEADESEKVVELVPLLADIWSVVWPTPLLQTSSAAPLQSTTPPSSTHYEDELLTTLTVSCSQILKEIVQIQS